jgi:hypothetical protein
MTRFHAPTIVGGWCDRCATEVEVHVSSEDDFRCGSCSNENTVEPCDESEIARRELAHRAGIMMAEAARAYTLGQRPRARLIIERTARAIDLVEAGEAEDFGEGYAMAEVEADQEDAAQ